MAFVGSLSGSTGTIAVTGSLVPGTLNFDLGGTNDKWRTVFATNITGSLQKTGGGQDFIKAGPNVTVLYNASGQWEITGAAGGGTNFFTEAALDKIFTTGSVAIGFAAAASSKGSDVFFAVSSSNPAIKTATFSGAVVASGSLSIKDAASNAVMASVSDMGVISGSSDLQIGGNITGSNAQLRGDLAVNGGDITTTATGAVTLFNTTATNVSIAGGATAGTNIGNASGLTTIAGGVKVSGNFISGSVSKNLTLSSNGDVTVEGDLTVSGNDIVFAAAVGNIANAATTLTIGSGATTLTIGSGAGKVVVPGDLEVQGTTMTVSASNLVIEDPLVGFGFLSGSVATSAGDRGFIGGITGAGNNVAFGWSNSNSVFVATRTTSSPEDATITVSALQPIRASKLEVNGSTAFVTSSNGTEITVKSTSDKVTLDGAAGKGVVFSIAGVSFAELKDSSTHVQFGAFGGKEITISGSAVTANAGAGGFVFQKDGVAELHVNAASTTTTVSGSAAQSVTLAAGTGATTLTLSGSTVEHQATIAHKFNLGGALIAHVTSSEGRKGFFPASDSNFDLGGPSIRWQNIYTGDLHLRNERGDYTLIEESDFLSIRFNKNGKRYKFLLERVPELDER